MPLPTSPTLELDQRRTYYPTGTNSGLYLPGGGFLCHVIELPWLSNKRRVSCIAEGRYEVVPRWTAKKGDHLSVPNVPGRSMILYHTANNALTELLGCGAPVTTLTGPGRGNNSRDALDLLLSVCTPVFRAGGRVFITIRENKKSI